MLEWNVFVEDINRREIIEYNIFNHGSFIAGVKNLEKSRPNRKEFEEQLNRLLRYYFWSKCEWEIVLSEWPPPRQKKEYVKSRKIDVYDQIKLNWDFFVSYVWENRSKL